MTVLSSFVQQIAIIYLIVDSFLFTLMKSSTYNSDLYTYFIGKVELNLFREVISRKHTTAFWLKRKGIVLRQENRNTFEKLNWTIDDWNLCQALIVSNYNIYLFQQLYRDWDIWTNGVWDECCNSTKTKILGLRRRVWREGLLCFFMFLSTIFCIAFKRIHDGIFILYWDVIWDFLIIASVVCNVLFYTPKELWICL